MKLVLPEKFKSLEPFDVELPDFVVLTGLNGAGKTQLLTAVSQNKMHILDNEGKKIEPVKYITSLSLAPNESVVVTREQISKKSDAAWKNFQQLLSLYLERKPNYPDKDFLGVIATGYPVGNQNYNNAKIINKIHIDSNKRIEELEISDFYDFYPVEDNSGPNDVFYQNFSNLFKRYYDRLDRNEYKQYQKESKGRSDVSFLSSEEFVSKFGEAPWDFVNKIISEAKLDYHINHPTGDREAPFELKLINNINKAEIKFGDLSSGEKVLMSLALALYNSMSDMEFPKILLMDEPDASLHPSMCKQFIDVVYKVFVIEKGVKMIITTHSPSTIALAPEEAIFVVNKTGQRVEKTSKDKALKILTSGVPSFSVNYENRRQVFVESPNDVAFYEKIYQKLSDFLAPEISLSFISSGDTRTDKNGVKVANCGQVINITGLLRNLGNNFVWGIIDWDTTNQETAFVKVIGNGKRYSIENYLFDPILVAALLLRTKIVPREEFGLINNENYTDFRNLNQQQMQAIADYVINKVAPSLNRAVVGKSLINLLNGLQLEVPNFYLHHQGHLLEDLLVNAFPKLNVLKRGKEEALKLEIINQVIDDLPELVSVDFIDVFKSVQSL